MARGGRAASPLAAVCDRPEPGGAPADDEPMWEVRYLFQW